MTEGRACLKCGKTKNDNDQTLAGRFTNEGKYFVCYNCIPANQPLRDVIEDEDNWIHRSKNMKCKNCMWFVEKPTTDKMLGRCRKHAPTLNGWPAVYGTDWCGDHKIDEAK